MGPAVRAYPGGIYGNTMTANPRALAVGTEVLKQLTPDFQAHVRRQVRRARPLIDRPRARARVRAKH